MRTYNDERLGAALRELRVPEHRPEFHAELHRRLAAERVARPSWRPRLRWALRAVAVAVVVTLAFVAIDALRSEHVDVPPIVQPADAAVVKAKVLKAMAGTRTLSGTFVSVSYTHLTLPTKA